MISIFAQAEKHLEKTAIISDGFEYKYSQLLDASQAFACTLLDGNHDLQEARVAISRHCRAPRPRTPL